MYKNIYLIAWSLSPSTTQHCTVEFLVFTSSVQQKSIAFQSCYTWKTEGMTAEFCKHTTDNLNHLFQHPLNHLQKESLSCSDKSCCLKWACKALKMGWRPLWWNSPDTAGPDCTHTERPLIPGMCPKRVHPSRVHPLSTKELQSPAWTAWAALGLPVCALWWALVRLPFQMVCLIIHVELLISDWTTTGLRALMDCYAVWVESVTHIVLLCGAWAVQKRGSKAGKVAPQHRNAWPDVCAAKEEGNGR